MTPILVIEITLEMNNAQLIKCVFWLENCTVREKKTVFHCISLLMFSSVNSFELGIRSEIDFPGNIASVLSSGFSSV